MILPLLLVIFAGGPFAVHEALRLADHYTQCTQHWLENALLLQNPICSDPHQRHVHGAKIEQTCRVASEENAVSPHACAWRELWRQGGAYRLWDSIVGSPWMLFGIVGICIFFAFQAWQHRAQRQLQERMYEKTLELTQKPASYPQLPPIQVLMPPAPQPQPQYYQPYEPDYAYLPSRRQVVDL